MSRISWRRFVVPGLSRNAVPASHPPTAVRAPSRGFSSYTTSFDFASGLRLDAEEALTLVLAGRTLSAWGAAPLGRTLTATLEKVARFAGPAISFPAADLHAILHQNEATLDAPEHRHCSRCPRSSRDRRLPPPSALVRARPR